MAKLKSKQDVIEWYWPDFLGYVLAQRKYAAKYDLSARVPELTLPEFWKWYITDGPLGVKDAGRFYSKDDIEYV